MILTPGTGFIGMRHVRYGVGEPTLVGQPMGLLLLLTYSAA